MTAGGMGMTAIVDADGVPQGIFTDGDLRRALEKGVDVRVARVSEVMTRNPRSIGPGALAVEAAEVMERHPTALQLRYLQTLVEIAQENNSTTVFPIPIDLLRPWLERTLSGPKA